MGSWPTSLRFRSWTCSASVPAKVDAEPNDRAGLGRRRKSPSRRWTKRPWVICVRSKARQVALPAPAPHLDPSFPVRAAISTVRLPAGPAELPYSPGEPRTTRQHTRPPKSQARTYLVDNTRLTNKSISIISMILEIVIELLNLLISLELRSVWHHKGRSAPRERSAGTIKGAP